MKVKLDEGAFEPVRAHKTDAGYDLKTPIDCTVWGYSDVVIDTGVHFQIPKGYVGFLKSKSGLNINHGITSEGVIDSGYTGSVRVRLFNDTEEEYKFKKGDKITQIVFLPVYTPELQFVDELEETDRGNNGFGSTGK